MLLEAGSESLNSYTLLLVVQDVPRLSYCGLLFLWNHKPKLLMMFPHSSRKATKTEPQRKRQGNGLGQKRQSVFLLGWSGGS